MNTKSNKLLSFGCGIIIALVLSVSTLLADTLGQVNIHDRVGNGWHMYTKTYLEDSGVISGTTKLKNYNNFRGFTGGLFVVILDENNNPVYSGQVHRWGINAAFFKKNRTRTATWSEQLPAEHLANASSIAVVQMHTPTNRVWKWIYENRELLIEKAKAFAELIQKIKNKQLTDADIWQAVNDTIELIKATDSDAWFVANVDKMYEVSYQIYSLAKKEGNGWTPEHADDIAKIVNTVKEIGKEGLDWEEMDDVRDVIKEICTLLGDKEGFIPENMKDVKVIVENIYLLVNDRVEIPENVRNAIENAFDKFDELMEG